MEHLHLQDLLAPTWKARARAADALAAEIIAAETLTVWGPDVQAEIAALQPSPERFLSALIGFWAGVSHLDWGDFRDAGATSPWPLADPDYATFPVSGLPARGHGMRSMWVWNFIERLGSAAQPVVPALIVCVEVDDSIVGDSAMKALRGVDRLNDEQYLRLLAVADRHGTNGFVFDRAAALAKHTSGDRIAALLAAVDPECASPVLAARFAVLGRLDGEPAQRVHAFLAERLRLAWRPDDFFPLTIAYTTLCRKAGTPSAATDWFRGAVNHPEMLLRAAAALYLGEHGGADDMAHLQHLAEDEAPWVLLDICRGLIQRDEPVAQNLLHRLAKRCIANYDGGDGHPHDIFMVLLEHQGAHGMVALDPVLQWWNRESASAHLDREPVNAVLRLSRSLGDAAAAALLPGLENALAYFTRDDDGEEELPALNEPGAVPIITEHLQQAMLAAGSDAQQAEAMADVYKELLSDIAENLDTFQADIDSQQADYDAEQRRIYPEQYAVDETASEGAAAQADADPEAPYEDEFVTGLREWIAEVKGRHNA